MLDVCPIQPPAPVVAPLQAFYDEVRPASPKPMWVSLEAHHEAGHAVYGYRFGIKFRRATIVPSDKGGGYVLPVKKRRGRQKGHFEHPPHIHRLLPLGVLRDPDLTPTHERELHRQAEMTLAGPLAVALRFEEKPRFEEEPDISDAPEIGDGTRVRALLRQYAATDDEQVDFWLDICMDHALRQDSSASAQVG